MYMMPATTAEKMEDKIGTKRRPEKKANADVFARAKAQVKGNLAHTVCGWLQPNTHERSKRWVLGFPNHRRSNRRAALAAAGKAHVVSGRSRNRDRGAENSRQHALCFFPPRAHFRGLRNHLRGCISRSEERRV